MRVGEAAGMVLRLVLWLACIALLSVAVTYCTGCSSSEGNEDAGELEQLEHDARQVDEGKGEHDAAPELEHDAGPPKGITGAWKVMRTRVEPASHLDVCEDAVGNVRDPSASESWAVGSKVEGSKLGVLTLERAGATLELSRGAPLKIEGFVRLTSPTVFEGSITITGNAPTPSGDGWRTCTTTQTVRGWQ